MSGFRMKICFPLGGVSVAIKSICGEKFENNESYTKYVTGPQIGSHCRAFK
jgi:hypothetical protein